MAQGHFIEGSYARIDSRARLDQKMLGSFGFPHKEAPKTTSYEFNPGKQVFPGVTVPWDQANATKRLILALRGAPEKCAYGVRWELKAGIWQVAAASHSLSIFLKASWYTGWYWMIAFVDLPFCALEWIQTQSACRVIYINRCTKRWHFFSFCSQSMIS